MQRRTSAGRIQKDTSSAKVMAAILFVVLLIVIFGNRILSAGLEVSATPPDRSGNNGSGNKAGGNGSNATAPRDVTIDYPAECLKQAPLPQGSGLLAAEQPEGVSVVTPVGESIASISSRGPVGFSASGKFLATDDGKVWTSTGTQKFLVADDPTTSWAWSPVADCIVAADRRGLVVGLPKGGRLRRVLTDEVDTFAFSPSGDHLLMVMASTDRKRGGIWLADLGEREMRVLMPLKESAERWVFYGWSRGEKPILVAAGGKAGPATDRPLVSFLPVGASSTCGDEIVVADKGRIATFGVTGTPKFLAADDRYKYLSVTCAPDGRYLAAVRVLKGAGPDAARLALLERDGSFVSLLTRGLYRDQTPSWGPSGTGVVLVRRPLGADDAAHQVWFLPEGGVVQEVGLPVVESDGTPVFDWSADGAPGHPL